VVAVVAVEELMMVMCSTDVEQAAEAVEVAPIWSVIPPFRQVGN
jgi:hypothetical protein